MAKKTGMKLIANNKKAYHDYFILETYEAGIALHGTEVKSLRMGKCSIKEAFIRVENEEVFIYGMHISPYEKGNIFNKDPLRVRKLLLHKYATYGYRHLQFVSITVNLDLQPQLHPELGNTLLLDHRYKYTHLYKR